MTVAAGAEQAGDSLEHDELQRLLAYVFKSGERGPVGGWHAPWDETPAAQPRDDD